MKKLEDFKSLFVNEKGAVSLPLKFFVGIIIVLIILLLVSFVAYGVRSQGEGALKTLFNIDKWLGRAAK